SFPIAQCVNIKIDGDPNASDTGNDTLTLDTGNGALPITVTFDGGGGTNVINLVGIADQKSIGPVSSGFAFGAFGDDSTSESYSGEKISSVEDHFVTTDQVDAMNKLRDNLIHFADWARNFSASEFFGQLLPAVGRGLGGFLDGAAVD